MWTLMIALLSATSAFAGPVDAARAAERAGDWAGALGHWRACVEAGEARVPQCRRRVQWLHERRYRGDFGVLTMLEQARRAKDRAPWVPKLQAALQDDLSDGLHRDVGLWLLAEQRDAGGGQELGAALWARHRTGPEASRVADAYVRVLVRAGRLDEAAAVEAAVTPEFVVREGQADRARLQVARTRGAWVAAAAVLAFALPAVPLAWRRRRGARPWGLLPLAVFVLGGGLLAHGWEPGLGRATPELLAAAVSVHLLAAGALGAASGAAANGLRALAAAATLGAGYLVLYAEDLLGWVGL